MTTYIVEDFCTAEPCVSWTPFPDLEDAIAYALTGPAATYDCTLQVVDGVLGEQENGKASFDPIKLTDGSEVNSLEALRHHLRSGGMFYHLEGEHASVLIHQMPQSLYNNILMEMREPCDLFLFAQALRSMAQGRDVKFVVHSGELCSDMLRYFPTLKTGLSAHGSSIWVQKEAIQPNLLGDHFYSTTCPMATHV